MSVPNTPGSRLQDTTIPQTADISKMAAKGSARFGALSHHSFFSRHNPHPHRVNHIPGLNGSPVCMVNDDWYMTSLFPHPLTKSQVFRTTTGAPFSMPFGHSLCGGRNSAAYRKVLLSEAWKEELKDLAAKVSISTQARKDKKDDGPGLVRRKTQYSAQTGRVIPPSTTLYQRHQQPQKHRLPIGPVLHDQELMVLELLCQILQTDSLSVVQHWLLLAGQREKDLVMGLIEQAVEDSTFPSLQEKWLDDIGIPRRHSHTSQSVQALGTGSQAEPRQKQRLHTRQYKLKSKSIKSMNGENWRGRGP
ncbi:protein TBATA isoform X2 [Esox lucius]|uniref:protein TBATA isoform X2 n=1 Tax=Esox lucius TaxID=8010 RepID=UPI00147783C1|nr:protein TBATA isoform X2 [Esox lucius]